MNASSIQSSCNKWLRGEPEIDSNIARAKSGVKLVLLDHFYFWLFTGGLLKLCYGDCIDPVLQVENYVVYFLRFLTTPL